MNYIICAFFIFLFFAEYLTKDVFLTPIRVNFLIDLLSILAAAFLCLTFAIKKRAFIKRSYLYIFFLFILLLIVGAIINHNSPKEFLLGIRTYFKYFPFFLFPIIIRVEETDIRRHLKLLLLLCIIQCPIALYQRFFKFNYSVTGDVVYGTLMSSAALTIVMVCAISFTYSFYLRKLISLKSFIIIASILFLPTAINETKVTLVILPIALFLPAILDKGLNFSSIKNVAIISLAGIIMFFAFTSLYSITMKQHQYYVSIYSFFGNKDRIKDYFFRNNEPREDTNVGRGSAIYFAVKENAHDLVKFAVGRGIGGVATSRFKKENEINFYSQRGAEQLTLTILIWETGFFGTILFFTLFILAGKDCYILLKSKTFFGHFALGWFTVLVIIGLMALTYTNFFYKDTIFVLFWYLTGVAASKRYGYEKHYYST